MNVVYLVRGYLGRTDKEKRNLYVGNSPKIAFDHLDSFAEQAEIVVEIWESGNLIKEIKK